MQAPDTKPGAYFVSALNGRSVALLAGPFRDDHAAALAAVDPVRREAEKVDPRAIWHAFGTVRLDYDHPRATTPGKLNHAAGLPL